MLNRVDMAPAAAMPPAANWRATVVTLQPPGRPAFDLSLWVEPVWDLRSALVSGSTVARVGAPDHPDAADLEEIDVAVMAYASALLEGHGDDYAQALHIPISFATLALQRARERLFRLIDGVSRIARANSFIEICGLRGAPASRLIEVVSLARGSWAGMIGRVRPSKQALLAVAECGLSGLSVEGSLLALDAAQPQVRLGAFATAAQQLGPLIAIHGLPSTEWIDAAAAAGFTHASVAAAQNES